MCPVNNVSCWNSRNIPSICQTTNSPFIRRGFGVQGSWGVQVLICTVLLIHLVPTQVQVTVHQVPCSACKPCGNTSTYYCYYWSSTHFPVHDPHCPMPIPHQHPHLSSSANPHLSPHLDEIKPLWVFLLALNLLCNYLPSRGWVSLASLFHHMSSCIGDIFPLEKICLFPSSPMTKQQFSFSKYFSPFLFLFSFSWTDQIFHFSKYFLISLLLPQLKFPSANIFLCLLLHCFPSSPFLW